MGPQEFEHVIAAAAEVTSQDEFVVIGSQAILGSVVQPPASLLQSLEADIYPLRDPAAADLIDGALGDGSPFHLAFGYYAHGVSPETARSSNTPCLLNNRNRSAIARSSTTPTSST